LKFTVLANVWTSVMAYCEHCILVQQKLDVLVALTNSVLHQSVRSELMSQISKAVSLDINATSSFIQYVCPCLCWCRGIRITFTRCIGSTVLLPMTVVLVIIPTLFLNFLLFCYPYILLRFLIEPREIVWSDLHQYPWHIIATYSYSQTCHVQKVSCLSSEWV